VRLGRVLASAERLAEVLKRQDEPVEDQAVEDQVELEDGRIEQPLRAQTWVAEPARHPRKAQWRQ
jgi:hypothetical protein